MDRKRATPRYREYVADCLSPLAVYRRLAVASPYRFLFESVTGGEQVSRYSFLGAGPREIYRLFEDRLEVERDGARRDLPGDPRAALETVLGSIDSEPGPLPLAGGFVGYFGFDLIRLVERLPDRPHDPHGLPIALFARFDTVVVFDHARQRVVVASNEIEGEVSAAEAEAELDRVEALLLASGGDGALPSPPPVTEIPQAEPSLDGASFRRAVEAAKEQIYAGEIFQVVLARRFSLPYEVSPLALYRALRLINPSPYMVLLETPDVALAGASPEMLVRKTGAVLETRPIAGTRPRDADPAVDAAHAEDLLADPKERAEHVMLVDLGRNDLGRVAEPGSVRVASWMEIERYSHVMHIVSSVQGSLPQAAEGEPETVRALDALTACFPAGTVSGAPKIRAMEIIDELEPESRGPYAGAVGYLSYSGDLDTCITIRTLVVRDGEVSVTAGAGIVADSDPAAEERETENKAAGMLAAVALGRALEAAERAAPEAAGEVGLEGAR